MWSGRQQYVVIDAAVGVVERGSWAVKDAVSELPWLPNGPIATRVDWQLEAYERVSHSGPVSRTIQTVSEGAQAPGEAVTA